VVATLLVTERATFPSPRQRALLAPLFTFVKMWHRPRAHGLDQVPTDRPVIYIAKHPQGFLYFETIAMGLLAYFDRGQRLPFKVMEKQGTTIHKTPLLGWLRRNFNAAPATEAASLAALRGGESILLFPGGARELHGAPDRLRWEGRRGYARIAALAQAEVVPFAVAGADRQHPWRLRLGKDRTLWMPPFPLPVRFDVWFGAPMAPPTTPDEAAIVEFADRVALTTQALIDQAVSAQARARRPAA
jgi:1-acyl-sn-glycerol-3-phosphate acyltransferase